MKKRLLALLLILVLAAAPAFADGVIMRQLHQGTYINTLLLTPETYPEMVYIPTDGGLMRHSGPECSGMYDPRKVSIRNAAALGFEPCKRCEAGREDSLH